MAQLFNICKLFPELPLLWQWAQEFSSHPPLQGLGSQQNNTSWFSTLHKSLPFLDLPLFGTCTVLFPLGICLLPPAPKPSLLPSLDRQVTGRKTRVMLQGEESHSAIYRQEERHRVRDSTSSTQQLILTTGLVIWKWELLLNIASGTSQDPFLFAVKDCIPVSATPPLYSWLSIPSVYLGNRYWLRKQLICELGVAGSFCSGHGISKHTVSIIRAGSRKTSGEKEILL